MSEPQTQITIQGRVDKAWTDNGVVTKILVDGKWLNYSRSEKVPQPRPAEGSQITATCNPWPADSDDPRLYIYKLTISSNGHAATASPPSGNSGSAHVSPVVGIRQTALMAAASFLSMKPSYELPGELLQVAEQFETWILDPQTHLMGEVLSEPISDESALDSIPF